MKKLYWKLFIWFWGTMLLMVLTAAIITNQISNQFFVNARAQALLRAYAHSAIAVLNNGGPTGLARWLKEVQHIVSLSTFVVNDQHQDLLKRELPNSVNNYLSQSKQSNESNLFLKTHDYITFGLIFKFKGKQYHLITEMPRFGFVRPLLHARPELFNLRLLIALIVSSLVCLLITRYLTKPIRQLSNATKKVANGEFDARVSPLLGKRRDEIYELALDFDHMVEKLQHLMQSQVQLLRDISHELRSPLARLQVASELTRKKCHSIPDSNREFDRMSLELERLNELIGEILSLARIDADQRLQQMKPFNLINLLTMITDDANFEAGVDDMVILDKSTNELAITANKELIRRAVENIVRNALRYTPEDKHVYISLDSDDKQQQLLLQIRDQGPGLADEKLPRIFEPFYRTDAENNGYGLGLAIAKRAIELHHGEIKAENCHQGGLIVTIRLPLSN